VSEISARIYRDLLKTNFFETMRGKVYQFIIDNPVSTMSEGIHALSIDDAQNSGIIGTRYNELQKMRMIEIVKEVKDPFGNHMVGAYKITDCEPIPLPKTIPLKQQIKDRDELLLRCYHSLRDVRLSSDIYNLIGDQIDEKRYGKSPANSGQMGLLL